MWILPNHRKIIKRTGVTGHKNSTHTTISLSLSRDYFKLKNAL